MFHILLIVLLIIGTLGVAVYGGVSLLQTTQGLSDTQTNLRRLEMVAWDLRNSNGVVYQANAGYTSRLQNATYTDYSIPDPVFFANPYTVDGINFHYCPYSAMTGSGSSVAITTPGGSSDYTLNYFYLGASSFGQKLLSMNTGTPDSDAPAGTIAVVTMPSAGTAAAPECDALTTANGATTVPGGHVAAITAKQSLDNHSHSAAKIMNLYVGVSASGDGTGRDSYNAMTLDQAMDVLRAVQPRVLNMNLASGSYTATSTTMAATGLDAGNPLGTKLIWHGAGSGSTLIGTTGTYTVDLPVTFQMTGLAFGSTDMTLNAQKGGNLILDDAALTSAAITLGGQLTTVGAASNISSPATMIINPGGKLSLSAPLTYTSSSATTGIQLYGGEIDGGGAVSTGTLAVYVPSGGTGINITSGLINSMKAIDVYASSGSPARGILIAPAGQLNTTATITIHNTPSVAAVDVAGTFTLYGANLLTPNGAAVGVRLVSGGEFNFGNNGAIGSSGTPTARPAVGVQDLGGTKIGGGNSGAPGKVYATVGGACWNFVNADSSAVVPNLFSRSKEGDGTVSTPTDSGRTDVDFLQIDNRSYWTCTGPSPGLNP